jgi:hypothetical protein
MHRMTARGDFGPRPLLALSVARLTALIDPKANLLDANWHPKADVGDVPSGGIGGTVNHLLPLAGPS